MNKLLDEIESKLKQSEVRPDRAEKILAMPGVAIAVKNAKEQRTAILAAAKECDADMRRIGRINEDLEDPQIHAQGENYWLASHGAPQITEGLNLLANLGERDFEYEGELGVQHILEKLNIQLYVGDAAGSMRRSREAALSQLERIKKHAKFQGKDPFKKRVVQGPVAPASSLNDRRSWDTNEGD